jgi:RNA-directed DNA polymerase
MQYTRLWYKTLRRRSHKIRITWARMKTLAQTWLPPGRILHPWPEQRFNVFIQGKSRMH